MWVNTWGRNQEHLERVLYTWSQCPVWRLTDYGSRYFNVKHIRHFPQCCNAQKHCNTFGRYSEGIDVHNDFEVSLKWSGISQIVKKDSDFRFSGLSCFPATKENKTTHYAVHFTTRTLRGKEGKTPGPRHISNILKKTLKCLAMHNEMKLAHLGMLLRFGQQDGDTAN